MKSPDVMIVINIAFGVLLPELISDVNEHSFLEPSNYAHKS